MKKILIFSEYYIPSINYGGPLTSIKNIVETCSDEFEFYIVSYNHDFNNSIRFKNIKEGWNKVGHANVLYCDDKSLKFNRKVILEIINMEKFDLIWLTGIFRPEKKWIIIKYCDNRNIPVLISPRGEVSPGAIRLKKAKKILYSFLVKSTNLFRNTHFHITHNDESQGLKKYFNISENKIYFAPNISSDGVLSINKKKEKNEINFIFISRIHKKKNLVFAVESVIKLKGKIFFDIYGPIEDSNYWNDVKNIIETAPKNVSIKYKGVVEPEKVSELFKEYHFLLFPTYSENFGHVIAEAISNSCPAIISKNTTPWDDMNEYTGLVLSLDNPTFFVNTLQELVDLDNEKYQYYLELNSKYIKEKLRENNAVEKHKNMLNTIICKYNIN